MSRIWPLIFILNIFCFFTLAHADGTVGDAPKASGDGVENVIIIGSGPAGLTAAIYTARDGFNPIVIEGVQTGGQLTVASFVENFPGFPEPVLGPDLMLSIRKQAEKFGTRFIQQNVTKVDVSHSPFDITLEDGSTLKSKTLIVATGASVKWLGLPSEKKLVGKGVSGCATCDGFFFRGQDVAVVGGGDVALDEALFLTRFAKSVTIIHRRGNFKASQILQQRVKANPKIKILFDSVVDDILGEDAVSGIRVRNTLKNSTTEIPLQGVFVAIGHQSNTDLFKGQLALDKNGLVIVKPGSTKTSIPGVFAAGDVADPEYRQAVIAAGAGSMAGIDARHFLEGANQLSICDQLLMGQ